MAVGTVLRIRGLAGRCTSFGLSRISFSIPGKAVVKLVNRGKTKGDAAVGTVLSLVRGSSKAIAF